MPLPKLLLVPNSERVVMTPATVPMETWINIDDISTIGITCPRSPHVEIRLRSDPERTIVVKREAAVSLIARLRAIKQ